MFRRIAVAAVAVCLTTFAIAADAAFSGVDKGHVKIDAVAKPGLGAFSGEVSGVDVKEAGGKLVFSADLESRLKMGLRQDHCKKAFETEKHKSVTLTVDKSKLKMPADNAKESGEVTGDLKLHGVTKPVKVTYKVSRTGSDYHIKEAKFSFNYPDFGVEKICKLGVCVEPSVTITVEGVKVRDQS
jgi:polyisoprenoid-binding protein YceI